jgi:RHS repeat-associated protein
LYDSATEQVFLRNRYYTPGTGRFNAIDPIGYEGGHNLYGYCDADPTNATDWNGTIIQIGKSRYRRDSFKMSSLYCQALFNLMADDQTLFQFNRTSEPEEYLNDSALRNALAKQFGERRINTEFERLLRATHGSTSDAFWKSIGKDTYERASDTLEGAAIVIQPSELNTAYNQVVKTQSAAIGKVWSRGGGWEATSYALGNITGTTSLIEGVYGVDLVTAKQIESVERWSRGLQGGGSVLLTGTASVSTAFSMKAGYQGTGFGQTLRWATTWKGYGVREAGKWARTWGGSGLPQAATSANNNVPGASEQSLPAPNATKPPNLDPPKPPPLQETAPSVASEPSYPLVKYDPAFAAEQVAPLRVQTPYETAVQSADPILYAARARVEAGAPLYRVYLPGTSSPPEVAQYWGLLSPNTPGYEMGYGIYSTKPTTMVVGTLKPGTPFIVRSAPANPAVPGSGGFPEVAVPPGGVVPAMAVPYTPGGG